MGTLSAEVAKCVPWHLLYVTYIHVGWHILHNIYLGYGTMLRIYVSWLLLHQVSPVCKLVKVASSTVSSQQ